MIKTRTRRGFTLIELVIVIAILAILASVSLTAFTGVQAGAENTVCLAAADSFGNSYYSIMTLSGGTATQSDALLEAARDVDRAASVDKSRISGICPNGGDYTVLIDETGTTVLGINCSYHGQLFSKDPTYQARLDMKNLTEAAPGSNIYTTLFDKYFLKPNNNKPVGSTVDSEAAGPGLAGAAANTNRYLQDLGVDLSAGSWRVKMLSKTSFEYIWTEEKITKQMAKDGTTVRAICYDSASEEYVYGTVTVVMKTQSGNTYPVISTFTPDPEQPEEQP